MMNLLIKTRHSLLLMLFSVGVLLTPAANLYAAQSGVVTSENEGVINIRAGKGTDTDILRKVKKGDKLQVLDSSDEEWYQVALGKGKVGYIHSEYVVLGSATESTTTDKKAVNEVVVTGNVVNIRAGKGTDTQVVGKAKKADKLEVVETSGDWYKVELGDGKTGYVHKNYVKAANANAKDDAKDDDKTDSSQKTAGKNQETTGTVVTKSSSLNVRSGTAKDAEVVGKIEKGSQVRILQKSGEWYKVELEDGSTGYVDSRFIKVAEGAKSKIASDQTTDKTDKSATDDKSVTGEGIVTTKSASLNVRADNKADAKLVGSVAKGDKVTVLGKSGDWYKVELEDGTIGYAHRQFVKLTGNKGDNASSKKALSMDTAPSRKILSGGNLAKGEDGVVTTKGSPLNIRAGKNTNAKVVTKVHKGNKVRILEKSGDWYKIKLEDGTIGYASSQFIK